MKKSKVSLFENVYNLVPIAVITLYDWIKLSKKLLELILQIRATNNIEERKRLKALLPVITPCGVITDRSKDGEWVERSNIICIDIDGKDNTHITNFEALKSNLSQMPYMAYCGLSASGNGLLCFIKMEAPNRIEEHYNALDRDFGDMNIVIDPCSKKPKQPRFYSYDENAYINEEATIYTGVMTRAITSHPMKTSKETINNDIQEIKSNTSITYQSVIDVFINPSITQKGIIRIYFDNGNQKVIYDLIKRATDKEFDVTKHYSDWRAGAFIIARYFKEEGRELFHELSQFYPAYCYQESDSLYNEALQNEKYNYSIKSLMKIIDKYGL